MKKKISLKNWNQYLPSTDNFVLNLLHYHLQKWLWKISMYIPSWILLFLFENCQQKLKMQLLNKLYLKLGLYLDHASRFQDQDHTFHFWAFFSFWKLPLSPQTRNNGFNFSVGNFQHISLTFSFKTCKWFKAQHRQSWKLDGREMDFHSWILYIQNKKGQKEEKPR